MNESFLGRTKYNFWFVEETHPRGTSYDDATKVTVGIGTLVNYDPATSRATVVEGKYKGWFAPYIILGVKPIPPLELLAREAK